MKAGLYKKLRLLGMLLIVFHTSHAQFLMDMVDTTAETGKGLLNIYRKFDHLRFSGYIQPQFQWAASKGIESFEGGNFSSRVNNRFMLRRSRIRIDYVHFNKDTLPGVQFVFQFDANERRFTVRDVWGRIFENRFKLFSLTTGMFARPFGYEINLSSSDRESPERGRMSQTLMKSERDLGAMISLDVRKEKHVLKKLKIDLGIFNGQGINAEGEFDNVKDVIGRISVKPINLGKNIALTAGASTLYGGLENNTRYHFTTEQINGSKAVVVDSSLSNLGKVSPRQYYGGDVQLKIKSAIGTTELRGEYILGKQTGIAGSTETPGELATGTDGFYARNFDGAYFYFIHTLFDSRHQLLVKYDWYDPNTKVKKNEISSAGGFSNADVKYNSIGFGYLFYLTPNVKWVLYYARVFNERTQLPGFTGDVKDDVFTCRLQFRF
jgi:hypothetical protein